MVSGLAGLIVIAAIVLGFYYQSKYENAATNRAADYAEHAEQQIGQTCFGIPVIEQPTCLKKARTETDLQTRDNQRTALWTSIMGIAALIGMGLSAVGVYLVWTTFRATRESNEIASDTAKRQLRAYVLAKNHKVAYFAAGQRPIFSIELHNFGQTPAHEVRCTSSMFATPGDIDDYRIMFRDKPNEGGTSCAVLGPGDFFVLPNEYKTELDPDHRDMIVYGGIKLIFAGIISYRDAFGRRRLSTFRYFLEPKGAATILDLLACTKGGKAN